MTALTKYARLEATGLWRGRPEEQRREVIVSLGKTSLIITDSKDRPLAHWSLAAIARANPGEFPARYHPDGTAEESLEFTENEVEMVKAIEKLRRVIDRRRPKPGRLRLVISTLIAATICALAISGCHKPSKITPCEWFQRSNGLKSGSTYLKKCQAYPGPLVIRTTLIEH